MKYFSYSKDFANRWRPQVTLGKPITKHAEGTKKKILGPVELKGDYKNYPLGMLEKAFPIVNGEIKPPAGYDASN